MIFQNMTELDICNHEEFQIIAQGPVFAVLEILIPIEHFFIN
jgi:hypothetical protein